MSSSSFIVRMDAAPNGGTGAPKIQRTWFSLRKVLTDGLGKVNKPSTRLPHPPSTTVVTPEVVEQIIDDGTF